MRPTRPLIAAVTLAAAVGLAVLAGTGEGRAQVIGPADGDTGLYTNGRLIQPEGRLTKLGNFPNGGALSPDGRFYWAVDGGHGINDVKIVDVQSGAVTQTLPLPGGFVGVAFSPDGTRAYVSGQKRGCCGEQGTTVGDEGDFIHVYDVDVASGQATELDPIAIPSTSGGSYRLNTLPPEPTAKNWPVDLDVSPDGSTLVAALNHSDRAAIVDTATGAVAFVSVGAYPYGAEFDPGGERAYVSNEYDGTVSVIDVASRQVVTTIRGVGGPGGDLGAHPEGLLADPGRDLLYAAVANRDRITVIDTNTLSVTHYIDVGREPGPGTSPVALAISPDGETLYSANAGEDAVAAIALTARDIGSGGGDGGGAAGATQKTVAVPPSLAAIKRFWRLRRRALAKRALALAAAGSAGDRAAAQAAFRRRKRALRRRFLGPGETRSCEGPTRADSTRFVAAVLGALKRRDTVLRTALSARERRAARAAFAKAVAGARAALPRTGCATSASTRAASAATTHVEPFDLIGRLPTAAYTTDVAITPDGGKLIWLAAKGLGAGPNPEYGNPWDSTADPYGGYVPQKLLGRLGVLDRPSDARMLALTHRADEQVVPTNATDPPPNTPLVGPDGGASQQIKHVFYVIRENRTYDQILGDDPRGEGDPNLVVAGDNGLAGPAGGVTPNAHALARTFPLLDHVYANSEVSIDGHLIANGGYAPDYAQKHLHPGYSGRGTGTDVGIFPVSFPPNAFSLDQAARQGVSFRSYGELGAGNQPFGNDGRPTFVSVLANTDFVYPSNLLLGCQSALPPPNLVRCAQDSGIVNGQGEITGLLSRINTFQTEFAVQTLTDTVPTFNVMILGNDHTGGTTPGIYSPQAQVADNDLGLGQLVELISNSPIWHESAIFVIEDDSQDGADHVDAHRMPAFVISPWAKRGAVVSTRFDQYSFLRTAMMIAGLRPLSLNDALATPLYDAFISGDEQPDVEGTRYRAIMPEQPLDEVNPDNAPAAELSAAMPWDQTDYVPQAISDRILWQSVYGADEPVPPAGPNASPAEHDRAAGAMRVFRHGGDPAEWLLGGAEEEEAEFGEFVRIIAFAQQLGISIPEARELLEEREEEIAGYAEEEAEED